MRAPQVVIVAVIAGCASGAAPRGPSRWDAMPYPERLAYMRATVMPEMKAVFTAFDRHRYDGMTCATCHGRDGEARGWKMPNPDLLLEPEALAPAKPSSMDTFMHARVAPAMGRLVGRGDFGCFGCHTPDR